ncbi:MAG: hypothetical protein ACFCUJ_15230 [Thiotrichales bacterium]
MRRCPTFLLIALAGLSGCGGSEAPPADTPDAAQTEASPPAATDPVASVARITAAEAATFGNIYPVTIKMEKGGLAGGAAIEVLTKSGERVAGSIELPANTHEVAQGDEIKVTLVLKQAATFTDALLTPHGTVASHADAERLLAPAETPAETSTDAPTEAPKKVAESEANASKGKDKPNDKSGQSVQFACTLGDQALSSTRAQGFSMGSGHEVAYLGQKDRDLLVYHVEGASGGTSYSNTPVEGAHPAIDKLPPSAPVTVVLTLGSAFPDDATKALSVTLAVKGITKEALSNLPLTVPILPSTVTLTAIPNTPGAEAMVQLAYDVYYVGTGGEVVIESVDLAHRSISGTVRADLKFEVVAGKGEKLLGDTISITDGRFDIPPAPVKKDPATKKTASASH